MFLHMRHKKGCKKDRTTTPRFGQIKSPPKKAGIHIICKHSVLPHSAVPRQKVSRPPSVAVHKDFPSHAFFVTASVKRQHSCSRSKFLSKLLKTFDKTFREIFPVFISTKRREKPSAFFDNNFVNNAYFSEAASSSSSHLASSSSKAPISSRMTCLCLWSS